ncbi:hypothetical protein chiPu_0023509, partial [Chiloscyllium punctatum]|nr:hypothetical protein [Chiloscyllium punctatum]
RQKKKKQREGEIWEHERADKRNQHRVCSPSSSVGFVGVVRGRGPLSRESPTSHFGERGILGELGFSGVGSGDKDGGPHTQRERER